MTGQIANDGRSPFDVRAPRLRGKRSLDKEQSTTGLKMPVWAWILIILLIVFALGGFGYSRR